MTTTAETFAFQTEARQLLDLMIHAVYSHKDIFLRELISNASDALDKRRFLSLTEPELLPAGTDLHIVLEHDAAARTLAIHDTGIGMSRDDLQQLIGTIAKSGTREFGELLKKSKGDTIDAELIGQFGVGFYSVFMVADRVEILTRKAGEDDATHWESTGDGTYTLAPAEREEAGTSIILHLKPADTENGLNDYTDEWTLRGIVKKYSDFVAYPIVMDIARQEQDYDDEGNAVAGTERTETRRETLNSMQAIWLRPKDQVTEEEYNEFYKHIAHDWTPPLTRIQAKIEGTLEYRMLLFIPARAPFDLFQMGGVRHGVHLYVKRVFIMDDCKELLPEYLRFVRGVVDSEDLSLNISRELLQQDRQIQRMRKGVVNKVLDALEKMRDQEPEQYTTFWREFGRVLKEGLFQDPENQERLLGLSRFHTTQSEDTPVSLAEYLARMPEGQDKIYYLSGESHDKVRHSPHLEAFRAKGIEVLLLSEPVDEVWTQAAHEYQGKRFQSIGRGEVNLDSGEEQAKTEAERQEQAQELEPVLAMLKRELADQVKDVRVSSRLTDSLACLVGEAGDMSPQLEQMMRALGQSVPASKRILEVNAKHPVMAKLHGAVTAELPEVSDYAKLVYGAAVLSEGGELPDPAAYARQVTSLLAKAL